MQNVNQFYKDINMLSYSVKFIKEIHLLGDSWNYMSPILVSSSATQLAITCSKLTIETLEE